MEFGPVAFGGGGSGKECLMARIHFPFPVLVYLFAPTSICNRSLRMFEFSSNPVSEPGNAWNSLEA